ncbi:PTS lactose/cellobiose transporter subunit IIA [Loigolactobacillus bifermentans]|jgi:PTS system cellobiose-specific IIA component|uniref:Uncharacterized protein n=1 Tax=Loigolactobacillus bifermentans DSM 20003 TaxID=1423726 RepID=A0A0R1GPX5_9LACO|nr:PTS lactose/cellobiose transporter subunit IIA [Loigolactobacillus bifermentans]KRK33418.1 hypothetical protein FC07_GL001179 [Loigolactobacillus bifermentans DSM 20003]QGG61410.1 PTS lactose/cellobiose transporter subunit IIA [Loigolactobacillus bifermentans]
MAAEDTQTTQAIMALISTGSQAKKIAQTAIQSARHDDFEAAQTQLKQARKMLTQAHQVQTDLVANEAHGEHIPVTLLMVHAQDHVMNAITFCDLAAEMIQLYQRLAAN